MNSKKIHPLIRWWVTPKLPAEDIFAKHNFITQWFVHPLKRRIAKTYLGYLREISGIKVAGITGSTGKTTTTEILASILKGDGNTVWSKVGIDPVYNIPNTILHATRKTKYMVLEMSVEYPSEMDYYIWLSDPDVGIVTNIGLTHAEFFGSKKNIAFEKGKLIKSLDKEGTAVLNKEDDLVRDLNNNTEAKIVYFGKGGSVYAEKVRLNNNLGTDFTLVVGKNKKSVHMKVFGQQFVSNALAAAAAASALGIGVEDIVKGIENYSNQPHRLNILKTKNGIIFDDTYNSNPKAAEESLATFSILAKGKKKVAVIGAMLELGEHEEKSHRELGKKAGDMNFDCLVGVGGAVRFTIEEASKKLGRDKCFLASNYNEAYKIIKPRLNASSALFVKGSRSIHLDKLVDLLK